MGLIHAYFTPHPKFAKSPHWPTLLALWCENVLLHRTITSPYAHIFRFSLCKSVCCPDLNILGGKPSKKTVSSATPVYFLNINQRKVFNVCLPQIKNKKHPWGCLSHSQGSFRNGHYHTAQQAPSVLTRILTRYPLEKSGLKPEWPTALPIAHSLLSDYTHNLLFPI